MANDDLPSLEELDDALKKARAAQNEDTPQGTDSGISGAFRVSIELLAGLAVGGMMGYALDKWLSTSPLFLIICFFLGFGGSMVNIYRYIQKE